MAVLFLDHGTGRVWGVSVTLRPHFTAGKEPVPIVQEARWAPGPAWTGAENLAPTHIRSPDRPARGQSLYRLSYPTHYTTYGKSIIMRCWYCTVWGVVCRMWQGKENISHLRSSCASAHRLWHVYVCVCVCVYVCMYVCVYKFKKNIYIYTHTHTHTHTFVHLYPLVKYNWKFSTLFFISLP